MAAQTVWHVYEGVVFINEQPATGDWDVSFHGQKMIFDTGQQRLQATVGLTSRNITIGSDTQPRQLVAQRNSASSWLIFRSSDDARLAHWEHGVFALVGDAEAEGDLADLLKAAAIVCWRMENPIQAI